MSFFELARERYSVRSYAAKAVEEEKIAAILKAAQVSPTAKNGQPQKIYVIKSPEALQKIRSICNYTFNAPLVFMICKDNTLSWKSPYVEGYDSGEMDATIACTHMMLAAKDLGLGSVWVMLFDPAKAKEIFNLPLHIQPVCLLPAGYPAGDAKPSPFHQKYRPLEEMVTEL